MAHANHDDGEEKPEAAGSGTQKRIWDGRLQYLPLIAAFVWLATLIVLLIHWAACNSPIYPSQNGYLPFISDIGAQALKPLFVVGCIISGSTFLTSLFIIHRHRDLHSASAPAPALSGSTSSIITAADPNFPSATITLSPPTHALTLASYFAVIPTTMSILALILLSVFDTLRYPKLHSALLMFFGIPLFIGCAGSLSVVVIQKSVNPGCAWLRRALWAKFGAAVLLLVIAVAFAVRMSTAERPYGRQFDQAAVLEWLMGGTAAVYMLTYWYDLRNVLRVQAAPAKRDGESVVEV